MREILFQPIEALVHQISTSVRNLPTVGNLQNFKKGCIHSAKRGENFQENTFFFRIGFVSTQEFDSQTNMYQRRLRLSPFYKQNCILALHLIYLCNAVAK